MEKAHIFNGIKKIISEQVILDNTVIFENIQEQTNLKSDLGIDSLDLINIITDMERYFDIEVGYESIEELHTIENCLCLVEQKRNQLMVA